MKSTWMTHKGKRIWYDDYANFKSDADGLMAEVEASDAVVCQQPPSSLVVLLDIHNTTANTKLVEFFKQSAVRTKGRIRKTAVIGISGLRKVFYEAVVRFSGQAHSKLFDDIESALDWLAADD